MERITFPLFALLAALPFYIPSLWFLSFFAFIPLLVNRSLRAHLWFGFVYGAALYWFLVKAIFLITGSLFLTVFLFAVIVSLYSLLQFGLSNLLTRLGLFYPLSFTIVEVFRLFFPFNGTPYGYLGKVLVNAPLLGLSLHYATVFGGTLFILTANYLLYKAIERWEIEGKRYLAALGGLIFAFLLPAAVYKATLKIPSYGLQIAIVQPFVEQIDKLRNGEFVKLYTERWLLTVPPSVDLVLLPETAIPAPEEGAIYDFVKSFSQFNLIFGVQSLLFDFERLSLEARNLVVYARKGKIAGVYAKTILVPFGEYTPKGFHFLERFIPYLGGIDYSPGEGETLFEVGKGVKLLPKVCNEVFYPLWGSKALKEADAVAVLSNDAWFGGNFARRHLDEVRLRAIETGKVFIFVNNNGYSGVVLPNGEYRGIPDAIVQLISF